MTRINEEHTTKHPHQLENEIFVGNTYPKFEDGKFSDIPKIPDYLKDFSTARLGEKAYDINGVDMTDAFPGSKPLFIGLSEFSAYNKLMEKRLSDITKGILKL